MANRLNAPTQFEALSPPWVLSQLDTNFTQNQAAWNDSSLGFVNGIPIDTGSANNYTVSLPFGSPSSYQDGMTVPFIPANTNTGASTITVSPLGSVSILNPAGLALLGGELSANRATLLIYKSAAPVGFRIVGPCPLTFSTTSATGVTVNCAGYTSINITITWTAISQTLTLNNLGYGVPVTYLVGNGSGGSSAFGIFVTDAGGNTVTTITVLQSGQVNGTTFSNANGYNINSGSSVILQGVLTGNPSSPVLHFSR